MTKSGYADGDGANSIPILENPLDHTVHISFKEAVVAGGDAAAELLDFCVVAIPN